MKVEITRDENHKAIGWSIEGETEEEKYIVNTIRNLQYGGFNDTAIRYDGREGGCSKYAGKLKWCQKSKRK